MNAFFTVEKCPELPGPDPRKVKNYDDPNEDYSYDDGEGEYNTIRVQPKKPQVQVRASRQRSKVWKHYIAAEEVTWDYAPHLNTTNR